MSTILLDGFGWTIVSSIATTLACFVAALYTFYTYNILKATSKAAQSSAEAAKASTKAAEATTIAAEASAEAVKQNIIANELSAYLTIRKDLTTKLFFNISVYAKNNKVEIDNSLAEVEGYKINGDGLKITEEILGFDILNNIEDLALFREKKILTIETIDAGFGYMILNLGNNDIIRKYVKNKRAECSNVLEGFETLYSLIFEKLHDVEKKNYRPRIFD